jgi:hypothetical protein
VSNRDDPLRGLARQAAWRVEWREMQNNTDWPVLLIGSSLVFGGIAMIGLINIGRMLYHWRYGRRVMGKVSRLNTHDDDGDTYTASVEYEVGECRFVVSTVGGVSPTMYRVGERVPVYYFDGRPAKGRIVTLREAAQWTGFVVVGLGIIAGFSILAARS